MFMCMMASSIKWKIRNIFYINVIAVAKNKLLIFRWQIRFDKVWNLLLLAGSCSLDILYWFNITYLLSISSVLLAASTVASNNSYFSIFKPYFTPISVGYHCMFHLPPTLTHTHSLLCCFLNSHVSALSNIILFHKL